MHVLYVKPPRKPKMALIVEKKSYKFANDIISTMAVMKPTWKCELVKAEKFPGNEGIIPLEVMKQAIIKPLVPFDRESFAEAILSALQ